MTDQNNISQDKIQEKKKAFDKAQELLQKRLETIKKIHKRMLNDAENDKNKD